MPAAGAGFAIPYFEGMGSKRPALGGVRGETPAGLARRHRAQFPSPAGAAPCTPSASTAASRSATNRTAATTATTPTSRPPLEIGEGEEIALETRDALDGQITPATTVADFAALDAGAVHPLDRPGVRQGRAARRHARDRVHRHHPAAHRVQRDHAGPRLPARRDDRAVPGALADQGQLGHLGAASRRAHSRRAVHGRLRRRAHRGAARRLDRARAAGDRRAAASRCRPMPPARCRPVPAASPACAPCRRARTAAIST